MKTSKDDVAIGFSLHLPDTENVGTVLQVIERSLRDNKSLPPGVGSPKGFMRHVVKTEFDGDRLILMASVSHDVLKPTILNLAEVTTSAFALALFGTMSQRDPITVTTSFTFLDPRTKRAAAYFMTQSPDDVKGNPLAGGSILAPVMRAAFIDNIDDTSFGEADLQVWEKGGKELLNAIYSHLEHGGQTVH